MNIISPLSESGQLERREIQQEKIIDVIAKIIERFRDSNGSYIAANCQHIVDGYVHLYGIHKDHQETPQNYFPINLDTKRDHYQYIKADVLFYMGRLPPTTHAVQIVGDQAPFSLEGTEQAKQFLRTHITGNEIILYGYAGQANADGARCANAAVTDIVREKGIQKHVLANIVGFHTLTALRQWGYTGPEELEHFMVVYSNDDSKKETGAVFGDGITTSDFMSDSLLVLEGGVQPFRQACNALLLNQKITTLSGLRSPTKASFKDPDNGKVTPYFSASVFLQQISAIVQGHSPETLERELQTWYANYFGWGKYFVGDPQRGDYESKQKLMNAAWELFMTEKLYLRIENLVAAATKEDSPV